jgi:hypothetical protein
MCSRQTHNIVFKFSLYTVLPSPFLPLSKFSLALTVHSSGFDCLTGYLPYFSRENVPLKFKLCQFKFCWKWTRIHVVSYALRKGGFFLHSQWMRLSQWICTLTYCTVYFQLFCYSKYKNTRKIIRFFISLFVKLLGFFCLLFATLAAFRHPKIF